MALGASSHLALEVALLKAHAQQAILHGGQVRWRCGFLLGFGAGDLMIQSLALCLGARAELRPPKPLLVLIRCFVRQRLERLRHLFLPLLAPNVRANLPLA